MDQFALQELLLLLLLALLVLDGSTRPSRTAAQWWRPPHAESKPSVPVTQRADQVSLKGLCDSDGGTARPLEASTGLRDAPSDTLGRILESAA
jgi:hypothetical protein